MLNKLRNIWDRNYESVIAVTAASVLIATVIACAGAPKVVSPFTGDKVTVEQYEAQKAKVVGEIKAEIAKLTTDLETLADIDDQVRADFERQIEDRKQMLAAIESATAIVVPPAYQPAATLGLGMVALGLGISNRRKDGVIKGQKQALDRVATGD